MPATPSASTEVSAKPHHVLVSLEVTGGFFGKTRIDFADGFNCLIGGSGTGKSTALALVRYALDAMPSRDANPEISRQVEELVKVNLGNGVVRLTVRTKHGKTYVIERAGGQRSRVVDENGAPVAITLDRTLFGADVFSQTEVLAVARTPALRLDLMDRIAGEAALRLQEDIRDLQRTLAENGTELKRLDASITDSDKVQTDLTAQTERLLGLDEAAVHPDQKIVNQAAAHRALREKEAAVLAGLAARLDRFRSANEALVRALSRDVESLLEPDVLNGPNGSFFHELRGRLSSLSANLEKALASSDAQVNRAKSYVSDAVPALNTAHARHEREYQELMARSERARTLAVERESAQRSHQAVLTKLRDLEARKARRHELDDAREQLLAKLSDLRDSRFEARRRVAEELNQRLDGRVRVEVTQDADKTKYRAGLVEALKGSKMHYKSFLDAFVKNAMPSRVGRAIRAEDLDTLAEAAGIDANRAKRLCEVLQESRYEIESTDVDDVVSISLRGHGGAYKTSDKLAPGQACTTILPLLLLSDGDFPLLIDQPEDNFDNRYVYGALVETLEAVKRDRQLIFTTHNANIVVLGDADHLIFLAADNDTGWVETSGSFTSNTPNAEGHLEGGPVAFVKRGRRYGHKL